MRIAAYLWRPSMPDALNPTRENAWVFFLIALPSVTRAERPYVRVAAAVPSGTARAQAS